MPSGQYKKKLLRLPQDLLDLLEAEAVREERSLNGQLVHALREWYKPRQSSCDRPQVALVAPD